MELDHQSYEFSGTRSLHSLLRGFSIPFLRIPVIEGGMSLSPTEVG